MTQDENILVAARRRFETYGYRRTSMAEIARDCGIAVGTVYRYFKSKETLLFAVVERLNERWVELAREAIEGPGSAPERLVALGAVSAGFYQENKLLNAILERDTEILSGPLLEEVWESVSRRTIDIIAEVLAEGMKDGTFRKLDPEGTAYILYTTGQALFNKPDRPYEEIVPLLVDLVQYGVLADTGNRK